MYKSIVLLIVAVAVVKAQVNSEDIIDNTVAARNAARNEARQSAQRHSCCSLPYFNLMQSIPASNVDQVERQCKTKFEATTAAVIPHQPSLTKRSRKPLQRKLVDGCYSLCIAQQLNLVDGNGDLIATAVANNANNASGTDASLQSFYSSISTKCLAKANAEKSSASGCNNSYLIYSRCVSALQVIDCPASAWTSNNRCNHLRTHYLSELNLQM